MSIPRTIVYHKVGFDLVNLAKTFQNWKFSENKERKALIKTFENNFSKYVGAKYGIAFSFARTALYFILKNKQFETGSEIIMPPITIKPMMDVILALGLKPVFVDIDLNTLCFDLNVLAQETHSKTKAILITYLFGIVPNMREIISFCRRKNLFIIEDFSHNLNAKFMNRKLGTFGDVGIYSCSITKTLDAYGGGIAVTDDRKLAEALQNSKTNLKPAPIKRLRSKILKNLIWNIATQRLIFTFIIFPLIRILRSVFPVLEQKMTGARLNLKPDKVLPEFYFEAFTSFQAKVGLLMLQKVDAEDKKRIANVDLIKKSLTKNERFYPEKTSGHQCVYWQFIIYPENMEKTKIMLAKRGIDSGATNLSLISGLGIYPGYKRSCPNAEYLKYRALFIPAHPTLSERDLKKIITALRATFTENLK